MTLLCILKVGRGKELSAKHNDIAYNIMLGGGVSLECKWRRGKRGGETVGRAQCVPNA